jgi:hypothetical protein
MDDWLLFVRVIDWKLDADPTVELAKETAEVDGRRPEFTTRPTLKSGGATGRDG